MEISASFDAATLNLAANVANVGRRASGRVGGDVGVKTGWVQVCELRNSRLFINAPLCFFQSVG